MDFSILPPEIISARMSSGPGAGPMLTAAAAWSQLAQETTAAAAAYRSVLAGLTVDGWRGPSSINMAQAASRYVTWLYGTASQAEQTAARANAAATAYQTALATTVPLVLITANRTRYLMLVTTNFFGQNSPAIATTEAEYQQMWAQDVTMMHGYQASSTAASKLAPFSQAPAVANPTAAAAQPVAAAAQPAAATAAQAAQAIPTASLGLDAFNSTVSSTSGAASVSSSSVGGANIATTNHSIAVNAERDAHQGLGPFLGLGPLPQPPAAPPPELPPTAGVGGPVASAAMGQATLVNRLSVPQAWAATTAPATGAATSAVPAASPVAAAGVPAAVSPGMFGEAMLGSMAGRGVNNAAAKLRRPSVVPRSPAAG